MTEYYKVKLEQGLYYQDYVIEKLYENGLPIISYSSKEYQKLIGENKAGIEIKYDTKFRDTGNFYIETAEKSKAENVNFIPSGIYRDDNAWLYIIGDLKEIWIFGKKILQIMTPKYKIITISMGTSQGYLLPLCEAKKICLKKII